MEEKIALVTGASRGIGSQIAKTLAKKNIFVVVNYSGSKEKAEQTAEEIINAGGKAVVYGCDISDFYATEDMVKEIVKQYGRLDILINNAGITKDNLIMRMSEADFDRVIEVNLKGAFNTIHAAARQMIRQKSGKIVNIASVSGVLGNAGQANYAAAKAGIIGLTKTIAREFAGRNIQVNAVAPGFIETDMTEKLSDTIREQATQQIPMKKFGHPEDVAEVQKYVMEDCYSTNVTYEYKAAMIDVEKNMIGFVAYGENTKYYIFSYDESGFKCLFEREMTGYGNVRGLYAGEYFYLVSGNTVEKYELNGFKKVDDIVL